MRSRTWIIAGLAAAALIIAGAVTVDHLPGRSAAEGPTSGSSPSSTSSSPSSNAPGAPTTASPVPTPDGDESGPPQSKRFTTEVIPAPQARGCRSRPHCPSP
ncbi:hypothetical protein G3T36_02785 [Diaminobutyricibacter tongyongensis]|uniref:Uncharacterized protein n=1 Tax=Leifsonia tongyongensis TaxID=1268043 RepID=A0A6L9XU34_9MICO|nr:hypothetical protein [Diaminobutyricibacter tongyongensis]NEN04787.1 hypothetical protein [Diaminobutyricibacter tongyongensis]